MLMFDSAAHLCSLLYTLYICYQILNSDTCVSPTVTKRNGEPVTGGRRNGTMSETRRVKEVVKLTAPTCIG